MDRYAHWPDRERIVANVIAVYKELGHAEAAKLDFHGMINSMAEYYFSEVAPP